MKVLWTGTNRVGKSVRIIGAEHNVTFSKYTISEIYENNE